MLRRNARTDLFGRQRLLLAVQAGRHEQVDAVRLALDLVVDPGQLDVQRLRRVADGTEHAEPAGIGDRRDHVAAVAEGDQWELAAQHVANG